MLIYIYILQLFIDNVVVNLKTFLDSVVVTLINNLTLFHDEFLYFWNAE